MSSIYLTKNGAGCNVKDVDTKKGIVSGYLSAFNNVDSDNDMIMPGSFIKTIKENGPLSNKPRIKHLLFHDSTKIIGKFIKLEEDQYGLYFESQLNLKTTLGRDALGLYDEGSITEHSIGFNIIKSDNSKEYTQLQELKLWEGSGVTWGSNADTPVIGVKSMNNDQLIKKIDRLQKQLHSGSYSDETFELLELQLEQIKSYMTSLSVNEPAEATQKTYEPSADYLISLIKKQIR